jgi:hypothetical protein
MMTRTFIATALFALATPAMPMQAQAMSVRQYESESAKQQGIDGGDAIRKIVADVAKVNPALSQAIHDYFYSTPPGQPAPQGLIAFSAGLEAVDNLAVQGKLDRDKVQIEGVLLDLVKTNVMPKFAQNAPPAQP